MSLAQHIRDITTVPDEATLQNEIRLWLDQTFPDLESVSGSQHAGPSTPSAGSGQKKGKRRRTLQEEIDHWEREQAAAEAELAETSRILPDLLADAHTKLESLLSSAQTLSVQRYELVDKLAGLIDDLQRPTEDGEGEGGVTLVQKMSKLQEELQRLEASLTWATILEQAIGLSEKTLSPQEHSPSPLAALPLYKSLHDLVEDMKQHLPPGMSILRILSDLREKTWQGLKDVLSSNLLTASEAIKWPSRIDYLSASPEHRRAFEQAFSDLLYLQSTAQDMGHVDTETVRASGLYPMQAIVQPIALRFKYHFQGTKSTNRVDKPEWAFANILDQIYEHTTFLTTVIQPLVNRLGYNDIDIRSEYILCLLPILLDLLRSRIPKLLTHPALLAHTIYQTVLFDEAVRDGSFDFGRTSAGGKGEWQGLVGTILREEGWFSQWLAGEKKFVDAQLNDIISSSDAWTISDETIDEDERASDGRKPTVSARQVKALIEQVTDRYSPLPSLHYRLPFLLDIQLPTLQGYHQRINGSLDAFENLSSAFARAIPGALTGATRSGVTFDQQRLTGGEAGLSRLVKAYLSSAWIGQAVKQWSDNVFFIELSEDLAMAREERWKFTSNPLIPAPIKEMIRSSGASVFDIVLERYATLCTRAEEMMVRLIAVEVETDLKEHLKRRWDQTAETQSPPSPTLLSALSSYTALLRHLVAELPPTTASRIYRQVVHHLVNHIAQRGVYSGWSKFTLQGARDFSAEITDFVSSSVDILGEASAPANARIEAPWRRLVDIAAVLKLPSEVEGADVPTFSQAMAAAWSDGPESLEVFFKRLGVARMDRGDLQAILRRRVECWR